MAGKKAADSMKEGQDMQTMEAKQGTAHKRRNGRLTFYHPNSKGTGTAVQLELRVNREGEVGYDCFFLEMARQNSAQRGADGRMAATFDWNQKVTVKLSFLDVCELLSVLEGHADHAGGQRDGLYHDSGKHSTIITLKRNTEPAGCLLGISRKEKEGNQVVRGQILLSPSEAIGLTHVFQASLFYLAFRASLAATEPAPAVAAP
jgi:hypothetical protein